MVYLHLPADKIDERRRATTIRHMQHVDAGQKLKALAPTWDVLPVPPDAMVTLPELALA
jgi:hypothetical protein